MKKQITIYFLFIACFLQLGHSMFPHFHVQDHSHYGSKHHHHDVDSNENSLAVFFSHFNHTSEIFSNSPVEDIVKVINEVPTSALVITPILCYSNLFVLLPKKEPHINRESLVIISPHLYSLQFRGPPSLI